MCITDRLRATIDHIVGEYQAGFRSGRSTTDHILTLRQIQEKFKESGTELHVIFVDFKQAYDTIRRSLI